MYNYMTGHKPLYEGYKLILWILFWLSILAALVIMLYRPDLMAIPPGL